MFTGLIETTGTVLEVKQGAGAMRITISAPTIAPKLHVGDSVAVSGVCLTALDITPSMTPVRFSADLAEETIARTTLSRLRPGNVVNLELPTPAGSPMGGHVVQGHVDGTGTLLALEPVNPAERGTTDWRLQFNVPSHLSRYIVPKGSITVDGISLTVAQISGDIVSVAIIPHTYAATSIRTLLPYSPLNIEVDVMAKYAERRAMEPIAAAAPEQKGPFLLTVAYLIANGY